MPGEWTPEFEKVLREYLPLLAAGRDLTPDARLTALGLDSLATVQLLVSLEDAFEVIIPDELLTLENFATADAVWSVITELRS
jgi:acyl carrier protein